MRNVGEIFMDRFFTTVPDSENELKRQLDILKNDCPLVLAWMADESYFSRAIQDVDPVVASRLEGKRQLFIDLLKACELPAIEVRQYFERKINGEKK